MKKTKAVASKKSKKKQAPSAESRRRSEAQRARRVREWDAHIRTLDRILRESKKKEAEEKAAKRAAQAKAAQARRLSPEQRAERSRKDRDEAIARDQRRGELRTELGSLFGPGWTHSEPLYHDPDELDVIHMPDGTVRLAPLEHLTELGDDGGD